MALQVTFGNGGTSTATTLQTEFLNAEAINEVAQTKGTGGYFNEDSVAVATVNVPNGGTGTGGVVSIDYADGAYIFDTTWNGVKDALLTSNTNENVVLTDFVHVDLDFSTAAAGKGGIGSDISLENLKRGNVATGAGNDSISITLSTNGASWQNTVDVKSGAGNDTITIGAGNVSGVAKITDGHFTAVTIDAGSGNDTIDLSGVKLASSTITGGTGNDSITVSQGADTLVYGTANAGTDDIYGFNFAVDKLQLAEGVTVVSNGAVPNGISGDAYQTLSNGTILIFHDSIFAA